MFSKRWSKKCSRKSRPRGCLKGSESDRWCRPRRYLPPRSIRGASQCGTSCKRGLLGVLALAAFAGIFIMGRKLAASELPKMQKAMEHKKLQKEAEVRLSGLMTDLRTSEVADLSAKNLGEEGFAYVCEALAFNDRCKSVDFSKNGIGVMGTTRLCEVLNNNDTLETLILDTNSIGDEGAEAIAKFTHKGPVAQGTKFERQQHRGQGRNTFGGGLEAEHNADHLGA
eukprot:jgi/Botrbrau1/11629/Bobra.0209s0020.1